MDAGVQPLAGRLLQRADETDDAPQTILLSHALWRRRFGGALETVVMRGADILLAIPNILFALAIVGMPLEKLPLAAIRAPVAV